jgi:phosphate transport system substrate-binding protein
MLLPRVELEENNGMKTMIRHRDAVLVVLFIVCLQSGMASQSSSESSTLVKVDGSSTVFPITEAVAEEFQKETKGGVRVTVGISGTGGGFKKFCRGETDVQDASRPISASEMEACRASGIQYYELPIAFDALTIAVSPQATWVDSITLAELKHMWDPSAQGRVVKWNQIRNSWPDLPLKLFGAGSDSGTFDYFTEAVVGKAKASRGDYTASEDDNTLVQGIANDKQALGYIPYAYFEPNKKRLKAVAVDGGHGPILPSRETVENGAYQPLSRPMFIYVNSKSAGNPEVKRFVEFYFSQAPTLVPQVKYVPLPQQAYELAISHFKNGKLGTAFQGTSTIGLKIEDLLKREAKL